MKTTNLFVCAISIAAVLSAGNTHAQTLSATLDGISPGVYGVNGTVNNGAWIEDYPSGVMNFTSSTSAVFNAFCVEPTAANSYGDMLVYQVQDVSLLPNSGAIASLIGGYLASSQTGENAAAVQWAIWEVTNDNGASSPNPSLLDGVVRIIPGGSGGINHPASDLAVATLADDYLAKIGSFTPVAGLVYLKSDSGQDVVSWNVVPEPGTAGLMAFSVLCLLRRRR